MTELTQELLKKTLDYDRETGVFVWKDRDVNQFKNVNAYKTFCKRYAGKEAGKMANGQRRIYVDGKIYTAKKLAWLYVYGVMPDRIRSKEGTSAAIDNLTIAPPPPSAEDGYKFGDPDHFLSKPIVVSS